MMVTVLELLLLISLFADSVIRSKCESQPASSMKCLKNLDQARQVLGSTIPPINDSRMTDNYYNISRALYPSISLPALYVKVTIQFLHDYQNGTKRIDDNKEKFTWSKACSYVSGKHIGLDAMSVFSLGTIVPQRRASELVFTVPPFCKNSPYAQNDEMVNTWRYIVSTLEDIVSNPKLSDPRLNSAGCVVIGHEGNIDEYPDLWFFYWFILIASFFSGFCIWIILRYSLIGAKDQYKNICRSLLRMSFLGVIFDTLVCIIAVPVLTSCNKTASVEIFAYFIVYVILLIVVTFLWGCWWNCKYIECEAEGDCILRAGSYLLCPFLFQTAHHFLWVVCGMISEPFWAIPIFLLECLLFASTLYSIFLYEKEFVGNSKSGDTTSIAWKPGKNAQLSNGCIKVHLFCCWLSFVLILITVALIAVGNGNAVNSPTAGAIEGAITVIFFWLARNSDLNPWFKRQEDNCKKKHKDKTKTDEESQELRPLNGE